MINDFRLRCWIKLFKRIVGMIRSNVFGNRNSNRRNCKKSDCNDQNAMRPNRKLFDSIICRFI